MISSLTGTIVHTAPSRVVIDVQGMSYAVELAAPLASSLSIGEEISIQTTLIVRQESLTVYGFASAEERTMFDLLVTVSGVGPRHALATLSTLDVGSQARAIHNDDDAPFRGVPGIGPKTARMIVESLKSKVARPAGEADAPDTPAPVKSPTRAAATAGLLSLGWKPRAADTALESIFAADPNAAEKMTTATLIRAALANLGQ